MTDDFPVFQSLLTAWLEDTHLFPKMDLQIDLILNPHAGVFRHHRRFKTFLDGFSQVREKLGPGPRPTRNVRISTWATDYPGHEKEILAHLQEAEPDLPGVQRLVITAGGDGTSRGTLISALDLPPEIREKILFFRLPLGTGNDAAETRSWDTALEVLSGRGPVPFVVSTLRVIEIQVAGQPVHYSFNIASIGLDAFVVHLTNSLKRWFPGNSYGLMVDVAAFFYEAFVKVVPSTLELFADGVPKFRWDGAFLLAAFGTSGNRTYGAGKRILPDKDNFCMAAKQSIFSKLAYRKPFYTGTHRGLAGITLASGNLLRVSSPVRIPLQMDGEVIWLSPADFPVTLTVVDRGLKVLTLDPLPASRAVSKL